MKTQELKTLSESFRNYKGSRQFVHYPKKLWQQAVEYTQHFPIDTLAKQLGVSLASLKRHIKEAETVSEDPKETFFEVESFAIDKEKTDLPKNIKIECTGSPESLAHFFLTLGGRLC